MILPHRLKAALFAALHKLVKVAGVKFIRPCEKQLVGHAAVAYIFVCVGKTQTKIKTFTLFALRVVFGAGVKSLDLQNHLFALIQITDPGYSSAAQSAATHILINGNIAYIRRTAVYAAHSHTCGHGFFHDRKHFKCALVGKTQYVIKSKALIFGKRVGIYPLYCFCAFIAGFDLFKSHFISPVFLSLTI